MVTCVTCLLFHWHASQAHLIFSWGFFFTQDSGIVPNTVWLATAEREVCHMTFIWPTLISMSLKGFLGNCLLEIKNIFWKKAHNRSHGIFGLCVTRNIFWDNYHGATVLRTARLLAFKQQHTRVSATPRSAAKIRYLEISRKPKPRYSE